MNYFFKTLLLGLVVYSCNNAQMVQFEKKILNANSSQSHDSIPFIPETVIGNNKNGFFFSPTKIIVHNGRLYVNDRGYSIVMSFDTDLNFIAATKKIAPEAMYYPNSLRAVNGQIKVLESTKFNFYDENLDFINSVPHNIAPFLQFRDFVVKDDGTHYIVLRNSVRKTDSNFTTLASQSLTDGNQIEIDSSGNIHLGDLTILKKYDSNLVLQNSFSNYSLNYANDMTLFGNVMYLSVDPTTQKRIVTDSTRTLIFDNNNNHLMRLNPGGASVFHNSHIYSVNGDGLYKRDASTGQLIDSYLIKGDSDKLFRNPAKIYVSKDRKVFVSDAGNHAVKIYDEYGNYLARLGTPNGVAGSGDGEFQSVGPVRVDSDGLIYVFDDSLMRFSVFDKDYNFVKKFGSQGSGDGQFEWLDHFEITADGTLIILDPQNSRFQKISKDGIFISSKINAELSNAYGFSLFQDKIYLNDVGIDCVIRLFDLNLDQISTIGSCGANEADFLSVQGYSWLIDLDKDGNIYIDETDWGKGGVIKKYSPTGAYLGKMDFRSSYQHEWLYVTDFQIDHHNNILSISDGQKPKLIFKTLPTNL